LSFDEGPKTSRFRVRCSVFWAKPPGFSWCWTDHTLDEGVVYLSAGIFPTEGIYFYALNAEDGSIVWKKDTIGETTQSAISPQGYMLASETTSFIAMGRCSPISANRETGQLGRLMSFGKHIGGAHAFLVGDTMFTGTREMKALNPTARRSETGGAWYPGRQIIATKDTSYMVNETEMIAIDRTTYPKLNAGRAGLVHDKDKFDSRLVNTIKHRKRFQAQVQYHENTIATLRKQIDNLAKQGKEADCVALKVQLTKAEESLESDQESLLELDEKIAGYTARVQKSEEELKESDATLPAAYKWRIPCQCSDSLIMAGDVLFAGGQDEVIAVDSKTGKQLWVAKVHGKAGSLAVASGNLFVSTKEGSIHCFGSKETTAKATSVIEPTITEPYPRDRLSPVYEAAADRIVRETNIKRGYCLVLGCGTGRLAYELANKTELRICGIESDEKKAEAAREALDSAGMFGRVRVDHCTYSEIPYSDYFANLVVSEDAMISGQLPGDANEALRMLKPMGGTVYLGQPREAKGKVKPLTDASLKRWLDDAGIEGGQVSTKDGTWLTYQRGALPGAGSWTHLYANAANTTCSDDQLVKGPLGLLWYGRPGPTEMLDRHTKPASPVAADGRLFVQGDNVIMAYDSYNGLRLWKRSLPGATRTRTSKNASNLALGKENLFVVIEDKCLRLDTATGETKQTYDLPKREDGKSALWGYVACVGDMLYGTSKPVLPITFKDYSSNLCDSVFAIDIGSGELRWTYTGHKISAASLSIGDGKFFLVDQNMTDQQRQTALKEKVAEIEKLKGNERALAEGRLRMETARLVVALDAATGKQIWSRPIDLTNSGNGLAWSALATIYKNDVLAIFGVYVDGHFYRQFFAGQFESRRVVALSATNGATLWAKTIGYRVRPLIIGDTFHAEPWAFDLKTGKQKTRIHPVTGREEPWLCSRTGHHCGCPAASSHMLFFRSASLAYYDLIRDHGTTRFNTVRPGCWINFIPADGLLLFPEVAAGCMCDFANQGTFVFTNKETPRGWALYSASGSLTPAKHWAINLGAPGDRRSKSGTLWLSHPRPRYQSKKAGLVLGKFNIEIAGPSRRYSAQHFKRDSIGTTIEGTDTPWIYTSGYLGLASCTMPLRSQEDGEAKYTVRLFFAELDNDNPGERVFDIKLQGKVVCGDLDIFKEAGGRNMALIKEFRGISVVDDLNIDFTAKVREPAEKQMPLLQAVEVVNEGNPG